MPNRIAQDIIVDTSGRKHIKDDWYPGPLPENIELHEMTYPDTSYSFTTFFSKMPTGLSMGYASGNYGHGIFTTGEQGVIQIGKFVVLQCTRIISNLSVTIKDHCMCSWGSVITDSWLSPSTYPKHMRRLMLERIAKSSNRHLEFLNPLPVLIEENVWIGFEAVILPGVKIGRGAVIGCKTIVSEDVPEYAVVVGNPARIIRYLDHSDTPEVKERALKQFDQGTPVMI
jgi:acetyltransferase-like isoleucine patch superfamily enzyme